MLTRNTQSSSTLKIFCETGQQETSAITSLNIMAIVKLQNVPFY